MIFNAWTYRCSFKEIIHGTRKYVFKRDTGDLGGCQLKEVQIGTEKGAKDFLGLRDRAVSLEHNQEKESRNG